MDNNNSEFLGELLFASFPIIWLALFALAIHFIYC